MGVSDGTIGALNRHRKARVGTSLAEPSMTTIVPRAVPNTSSTMNSRMGQVNRRRAGLLALDGRFDARRDRSAFTRLSSSSTRALKNRRRQRVLQK